MPVTVDLFDGVLHSKAKPQVHFVETVEGEAMDYDFDRDVGLIRIRPGRRLPASRVVPPSWAAQPRMKMITVGCSEGNDATAWSTSVIKSGVKLFDNSVYEAIECQFAPKQGRSGGGLYTEDGYLAGVCDFAEPRGNHGFYATPRSIYNILDRNDLMALYTPANKPRRGAPGCQSTAELPGIAPPFDCSGSVAGRRRIESHDAASRTPRYQSPAGRPEPEHQRRSQEQLLAFDPGTGSQTDRGRRLDREHRPQDGSGR